MALKKIKNHNNKFYMFLGIMTIILVIGIFMINSSKNNEVDSITINEIKNININEKLFVFESSNNDKEIDGKIIQTNQEKTIHTFDLPNRKIRLQTFFGEKEIVTEYKIKDFYTETGIAAKTHVFIINDLGVKEIWISFDVPNLGYDYVDGSRISCYGLTNLTNQK